MCHDAGAENPSSDNLRRLQTLMSGCCRLADGQHLTEDAVKAIVGDLARPLTVMCSVADLQMVNISLRVLSKPDTHLLSQIFRSLGIDWDERVLPPPSGMRS